MIAIVILVQLQMCIKGYYTSDYLAREGPDFGNNVMGLRGMRLMAWWKTLERGAANGRTTTLVITWQIFGSASVWVKFCTGE